MKILNVNEIASSCIKCKSPSCSKKCELGTKIPDILELIDNGLELEAAKLLYLDNPFPFVTGSLCDVDRKCYGNCIKSKVKDSVKYYEVESYLGNKYLDLLFNENIKLKDSKVAIVGGGIAGLTVAIKLIHAGFKPTIYEKSNHLGGILYHTLPSFRFDKTNYIKVIEYIEKHSNVYYGKILGENLLKEDLESYKVVVLTTGASLERKTIDESICAIELLSDQDRLNTIKDKNIVVIGGGNTAMDVSRSLAKNNNVTIVYRRNLANSPASKREINDMLASNVKVLECLAPKSVIKEDGLIKGLLSTVMELYDDGSSRLNFRKTDKEVIIDCDIIIEATGSMCDYTYLKEVYPEIFNESGWIDTNSNFETCIKGLYVGGDLYYGPKYFNSAIHSGNVISKDILSRKE